MGPSCVQLQSPPWTVSWLEIQLLSTNVRMVSYRVLGCRVVARSFQANRVCKGRDASLPQIPKFPGDFSSGSGGQGRKTFDTQEACLFDCEFLKDILKAAQRAPTVSRSDLGQCEMGELIAASPPSAWLRPGKRLDATGHSGNGSSNSTMPPPQCLVV